MYSQPEILGQPLYTSFAVNPTTQHARIDQAEAIVHGFQGPMVKYWQSMMIS